MKLCRLLFVVSFAAIVILCSLSAGATSVTQDSQASIDIAQLLRDLPTGERWLQHLREDLLPFWIMPSALGSDGNFPTYRCNDGSLVDPKHICPEMKQSVQNIVWLDREFVRAKSRQCYAYGVAFHLTGDPKFLEYAKKGVNYLRQHAIDRKNGGAISYWQRRSDGSWISAPAVLQRRSQDLAYALTGISFYYYLTRDRAVLKDILSIKDHIFKTYYDRDWDLLAWVKERSTDGDRPDQRELVAQLDQIYGYMLLLTPSLPEPQHSKWLKELTHISESIIEQFYSPRVNLFWGAVTNPSSKRLGQDHVDFGHSVKTLWLIQRIGKLTHNSTFVTFAEQQAARLLDQAYLENGTWARRWDSNGRIDVDKEWWILAELDQTASTLALLDPTYARYLPSTYKYWLENMVDHTHGGIWHMVSGATNQPLAEFPKQHSWKNAFHEFEHALVAYITTQSLHGEPVVLHYAFKDRPREKTVHPYFFQGKVSHYANSADIQTVTFIDLR